MSAFFGGALLRMNSNKPCPESRYIPDDIAGCVFSGLLKLFHLLIPAGGYTLGDDPM